MQDPETEPETATETQAETPAKPAAATRPRRTGYHRVIDYPRQGRTGWRRLVPSWRLVCGTLLGSVTVLTGLVLAVYATVKVPDINKLKMPTATVYEYSDGTVFYAVGLQDRQLVPISRIPTVMSGAIVSIENPTFYSDAGVAPKGIIRALASDVQGGEFEGGSTITQQFVKNAYLTDQQTYTRKLVEIFKAVKITRTFPKSEILDDYLNTVYFGRGSYGIEAASETYFGVPVDQITDPGRAAYLAALVNEPTVLSQTDPASQQLLRARWSLVLKAMVKAGRLTPAQMAATTWPTALVPSGAVSYDANGVDDSAMAQVAGTYLDRLHQQDPDVPDAATANAGGDVIRTTFDRADMAAAVRAVKAGLYDRLNPKARGQATVDQGVQVGLASVDTRTGELLALYPGAGGQYDDATLAQIEPGSQMSAFTLAAELGSRTVTFGAGTDGAGTAGAVMSGAGTPDSAAASQLWTLMGRVGLTQNLEANPGELPEPLSKLKQDPELGLGIAPESPARMAAAYAVFADGGVYHELSMALSVTVNGRTVWTYRPQGTPAVSAGTAATVTGLLSGQGSASGGGTAQTAAQNADDTTDETAGESGTIGGDASAWYSGYTTGISTTVGLWDQTVDSKGRTVVHSLAGLGGVDAEQSAVWPTSIWQDYMQAATGGRSAPFPPAPQSVWGAPPQAQAPAPADPAWPAAPANPAPSPSASLSDPAQAGRRTPPARPSTTPPASPSTTPPASPSTTPSVPGPADGKKSPAAPSKPPNASFMPG